MNVDYALEILRVTRRNIATLLADFNVEQLNAIPPGFNNNLIWNAGHIVATQQLLCYGLAGSSMHVDRELIERYRKGTRPGDPVGAPEVAHIRELLLTTPAQLSEDYRQGIFGDFKAPYPTSYGITLHAVEESIVFNNVHEGMHFGTLLALRKLV